MTLRNPDYGPPRTCEVDDCDHPRGAALRSVYHHGCVLCVHHENLLQLGEISLPAAASDERKEAATEVLLG